MANYKSERVRGREQLAPLEGRRVESSYGINGTNLARSSSRQLLTQSRLRARQLPARWGTVVTYSRSRRLPSAPSINELKNKQQQQCSNRCRDNCGNKAATEVNAELW